MRCCQCFLVAKETISLVAACLPHLAELVSLSSKEQRAVASEGIKPQSLLRIKGSKFVKDWFGNETQPTWKGGLVTHRKALTVSGGGKELKVFV